MVKSNISLASRSDDEILKSCLKENEMTGAISISFETEPSFFDALSIQGRESQVILIKSDEEIAGFGIRSIKPVWINGKKSDVGYLSGLRGSKKFRKGIFLAKGYQFLRELDQDGRVPIYLTTIIEDNTVARRILESGRAGLPNYIPIDTLSTFIIKPDFKKTKRDHCIIRGSDVSLEEILGFMNNEGRKKQFYPYYENSDFNSSKLKGLKQQDFYVAIDGNDIIGVVAKWDQQEFKQTRVVGYDRKMHFARPFINLASKLSNIPNLPKVGELLHYFYAAFPTTKDNDPRILQSLLREVASDPKNKDYDYFTLGLTEKDPLKEAVKSFSPRNYRSIVYLVSFEKDSKDLRYLNGKIPYLELGTL